VLGVTLTVCVHWALSLLFAPPASDIEPEWAWPVTALDTLVHDQLARPDSKPGLAMVSAAEAGRMARVTAAAAATVAAPRASTRTDLRMGTLLLPWRGTAHRWKPKPPINVKVS
jgi:hypothetical protein